MARTKTDARRRRRHPSIPPPGPVSAQRPPRYAVSIVGSRPSASSTPLPSPRRCACSHPPPAYRRSRPTLCRVLRPRPSPPFERFAGQQRRSIRRSKTIPRRKQNKLTTRPDQGAHLPWRCVASTPRCNGATCRRGCCKTIPCATASRNKVTKGIWPWVGGQAGEGLGSTDICGKDPHRGCTGVVTMSPELLGQLRASLPSHSPPPALPSCKRSTQVVAPPNPLDARLHYHTSASSLPDFGWPDFQPAPGQRPARETTSALQARLVDCRQSPVPTQIRCCANRYGRRGFDLLVGMGSAGCWST